MTFEDAEAASRGCDRIAGLTGLTLNGGFSRLFESSGSPDLALTNLERWLRATSSPQLHLEQLLGHPPIASLIVELLGGSQPIADSLVQNPELASLLFEPGALEKGPVAADVIAEGKTMIERATSRSHAFDRLRFLKQRWMLPIVVSDLAAKGSEEQIWRNLSELADALIDLCAEISWREIAGDEPCPVGIVGFGKLGGKELNYSSDVDLAFVGPSQASPELDHRCAKFAESLIRALSERMGRGSLYRVDLRLRPYGGTGALVNSFPAFQTYYRAYAEPWEIQALMRSRVIVGPPDLAQQWESMIDEICFRPRTNEASVAQMLAMKSRIEELAAEGDIKRSSGGIRDVEFLTQILQTIYGHDRPGLKVKATCDALRALDAEGVLEHGAAASLIDGYTFLRQLEHRFQLVGDRQTHELPETERGRAIVASLSRETNWDALAGKLEFHKRTIQTLYRTIVQNEPGTQHDRAWVMRALGPVGPVVLQWIDVLPASEAFYESLAANEGSLRRVERIARYAPALVSRLKRSLALTEMVLSGEIEEQFNEPARFDAVPTDKPLEAVAEAYGIAWTKVATRWALDQTFDLPAALSDLADSLLAHCLKRLYIGFDVLALGSYARRELVLGSDVDLLLLVHDEACQPEAETQAQHLLAMMSRLKRLGAPLDLDLRLRPEGRQGLLVRSYAGFAEYDFDGMEMWERLALGQARPVCADQGALDLVTKVAYALPLTPERLKELLAMKKRIEFERVAPARSHRQVKLGYGGLTDIEWFVRLHEMRYPTAAQPEPARPMPDRIRALGRAGLINSIEVDQLVEARSHLTALRLRMSLLGIENDVLPENPDKLDRLAEQSGDVDGNALLLRHEAIIDTVRAIYQGGLERLKAT